MIKTGLSACVVMVCMVTSEQYVHSLKPTASGQRLLVGTPFDAL